MIEGLKTKMFKTPWQKIFQAGLIEYSVFIIHPIIDGKFEI